MVTCMTGWIEGGCQKVPDSAIDRADFTGARDSRAGRVEFVSFTGAIDYGQDLDCNPVASR